MRTMNIDVVRDVLPKVCIRLDATTHLVRSSRSRMGLEKAKDQIPQVQV